MDIEQLSKNQIVLLTLLVSFVTSIATGIVTVSLMEQAPPAIAQTVNRVIERTVEKVVPSGQAASVVTQEKTVVVRESELISAAVERISPSVVRLYAPGDENAPLIGLGIVVSSSGIIIADSSAMGESGSASIALPDGERIRAFVTSRDLAAGVSFLQATTTGKMPVWTSAPISSVQPVLGQTVFMLSGKTVARIGDGIIESLVPGGDASPSPLVIDTNIPADSIMSGSPLVNTEGHLLGMSTSVSRFISTGGFVAASALMTQENKKEDSKDSL